jgi:hypothetical protein
MYVFATLIRHPSVNTGIYPLLVNKVVEKTKSQPSNPLLSSSTVLHMKHLQNSILGDSGISITGNGAKKEHSVN